MPSFLRGRKQLKAVRKGARMASKASVGLGKAVSIVKPGVGRKMVAAGRTGRAATRGQPVKAAKHARTLNR